MSLIDEPIVSDREIYALKRVSPDTGRKRARQLEAQGSIRLTRTPTGRTRLTYPDAERLFNEL